MNNTYTPQNPEFSTMQHVVAHPYKAADANYRHSIDTFSLSFLGISRIANFGDNLYILCYDDNDEYIAVINWSKSDIGGTTTLVTCSSFHEALQVLRNTVDNLIDLFQIAREKLSHSGWTELKEVCQRYGYEVAEEFKVSLTRCPSLA